MKRLRGVLMGAVILYLLLMSSLYFLQESLIFRATELASNYSYQFDDPFEESTVKMSDGAQLNLLHFKQSEPKGAILYFHGNAGDLSRWGKIVKPLYDLGYDVYIMDYRNYGKSLGERSSSAMYSDAIQLFEEIQKDFKAEDIIVYGRSLGATFATYVAAQKSVKRLILETPFYNLKTVVQHYYVIFPVDFLLKFRFPTNEMINSVDCPITIFHGTADRVVPYENAEKLKAENSNIKLITVNGGKHNNLSEYEEYWTVVKELLN